MNDLNFAPNFQDGDGFYEALIEAVQHLPVDEALAFSARLNLVLANQVGDAEMLRAALEAAKGQA